MLHTILKTDITAIPSGLQRAIFGMGCYWGVERLFWKVPGVHSTAVGFAGGVALNPTYKQVCAGNTGHVEVVQVVFDDKLVSYRDLLTKFWENHDPTQGDRQGNDVGDQYRSVIYTTSPSQEKEALASMAAAQAEFSKKGFGKITTEVAPLKTFYLAQEDHQQYLDKNPNGYCSLKGTGVKCVY